MAKGIIVTIVEMGTRGFHVILSNVTMIEKLLKTFKGKKKHEKFHELRGFGDFQKFYAMVKFWLYGEGPQ